MPERANKKEKRAGCLQSNANRPLMLLLGCLCVLKVISSRLYDMGVIKKFEPLPITRRRRTFLQQKRRKWDFKAFPTPDPLAHLKARF